MIQAVVNRMAANSFLLKGWSVTLGAALFALAAKDSNSKLAVVTLIPAIAFWGLDAYYLRQERIFRGLFEQVRRATSDYEPYSMDTSVVAKHAPSWLRTMAAFTVVGVHGLVAIVAITISLIGD